MICPTCESKNIRIVDSRYKDNELLGNYKLRRRLCECGYKWETYELSTDMKELERAMRFLNNPRYKAHWTNEEDKKLIELKKSGMKNALIAIELGRSIESVRKRVDILGIKLGG